MDNQLVQRIATQLGQARPHCVACGALAIAGLEMAPMAHDEGMVFFCAPHGVLTLAMVSLAYEDPALGRGQ